MLNYGYKYLDVYNDRFGQRRVYFKRRGMNRIPLPDVIGSDEFIEAYRAAFAKSREVLPPPRQRINKPNYSKKTMPIAIAPKAGVYLLMADREVIYVGASLDMGARITEHLAAGIIQFDRHFFIGTKAEERFELEAALIRALQPRHNAVGRKANDGLPNSYTVSSELILID